MDTLNIEKIKTLLEIKNKNQQELAKYIGIKESALSLALNGKRPFPMHYILRISNFFEVDDIKSFITDNSISNHTLKSSSQNKEEVTV